MTIEIAQSGTLTTVQDLGRFGMAHLGIPQSGSMDQRSAQIANHMVGNDKNAAVLEVTWQGIEFISEVSCSIALAGAEFICELDGQRVSTDRTVHLSSGSRFSMVRLVTGVRAYLAFAGGINVSAFAGSGSTLLSAKLGGFHGRALQRGDRLELLSPQKVSSLQKPVWKKIKQKNVHIVRAMPGPEVNLFDHHTIAQAFGQAYELSQVANRQGFRLTAEPLNTSQQISIPSSGLVPGSLQVTPDGQTILAMHDAQTSGGYPRILIVHQDQLSQLAQVRTGELIHFFVEK